MGEQRNWPTFLADGPENSKDILIFMSWPKNATDIIFVQVWTAMSKFGIRLPLAPR